MELYIKVASYYSRNNNTEVTEVNLPSSIFGSHSGVITLLQLDPKSRVEIHKEDGTKITYEYLKQ